jgi:hypothetical protein
MFVDILGRSLTLKDYIKYTLRSKLRFNALLEGIQSQIDYILEELKDLIYIFDIDRASGNGLDFIGILVGQPRITANYSNNNFVFDSIDQGFDSGVFDVGGDYISDERYKLLLKSKIIRNNADGWNRDEIIEYHQTMLDGEVFEIVEKVGEIDIKFFTELDDFSYQLLSQYPIKIAGVKINYEVPV